MLKLILNGYLLFFIFDVIVFQLYINCWFYFVLCEVDGSEVCEKFVDLIKLFLKKELVKEFDKIVSFKILRLFY